MSGEVVSVFHHKTLEMEWAGRRLVFDVPVDVFSTFQVDPGTRQLLKAIAASGRRWQRALDLGCGYGPIALSLAAGGQADAVVGIDRDALAATFAAANGARNGLTAVECRGGLAYEDVAGETFDLVATNLPAKAGDDAHRLMLLGASRHLRPGGEVWAVVVEPLTGAVDAILSTPGVEVRQRQISDSYGIYNYAFVGPVDVPADPYRRAVVECEYDAASYTIEALRGVADFDSLWRGSEVALRLLERAARGRAFRRVAIHEPTQGHLPVLLTKFWPSVDSVNLVSRDRLALKASESNVRLNGFTGRVGCHHAIDLGGVEGPLDLLVFQVHDGEGMNVYLHRVGEALARFPECLVVVAGTASFCGRFQKAAPRSFRPRDALNRKGFRALRCGV